MGELPFGLGFAAPPHRLSGVVYGAAVNHAAGLAALGDGVHRPPYKAPPSGVVLYVKPRHTFVGAGACVEAPAADAVDAADAAQAAAAANAAQRPPVASPPPLLAGATLGIVIGRSASAVAEAGALAHVAGFVVACDFSIAHDNWFRPQVRALARERSLVVGETFVAAAEVGDPDALAVRVFVDGRPVHETTTGGTVRGVARLVADISDFITLSPGDLILLGVAPGAPRVTAGSSVAVQIESIGRVETRVGLAAAVEATP